MVNEKENKNKRMITKRKHPLPGADMRFENEIAILKASVEFSNKGEKVITYKDVKVPGVQPTRISNMLKFFESIKLLTKVNKPSGYKPSKELIDFINNLNWNKEEEAKEILRQRLLETWFGDLAVRLLRVKDISIDDLTAELGKESMADPNKDKKKVTRLINWLKYADILEIDENNKVKIKKVEISQLPTTEVEKQQIRPVRKEESKTAININLSFLIEVNSQTKEEDVVKIIKTIKNAIQEIETDEN